MLSLAFGLIGLSSSKATVDHFLASTSKTYVSSTNLLPVLFPPSSKLPTYPPKIKYFHDGIDGTIIPATFHLGISCEISGSTH